MYSDPYRGFGMCKSGTVVTVKYRYDCMLTGSTVGYRFHEITALLKTATEKGKTKLKSPIFVFFQYFNRLSKFSQIGSVGFAPCLHQLIGIYITVVRLPFIALLKLYPIQPNSMLGIADLSRVLFPDEQEKTTIRRKSQDKKSDRITCNTSTSTSTSVFDQLNQFKLNHSGPSRNYAFDESGISPMIISPPKFRRNQKDDCRNKTDIVDSSDYKLESLDSLASLSIKDDIDVRKFDLPDKGVRELGKPPHGSSSLFPMAEKVSRLCSTSSKMLHQSSSTKRHNNEHQMLDATEIGGVLGTFCNSGPTSKLVKCRGDAEEQGRTRKNNTTLVDVTNSAHSTQSKMKIGRNRDGSCESMFVSTIGRGKCDDQVKADFKIDQTKKSHNSLTKTKIDKRTLLSPSYQSDTLMELISPVTTQRPAKRISKKKTPYRVGDASTTIDHNTKNLPCLEEKGQSESSDQDDVCINNDIKTTNKSLSVDITNDIKWQKYNDYKKYEGARLAKRFSRKTYLGTVYESFLDNENKEIYFGVRYDDGDEEDLSHDELLKCISL